MVWPRPMPMQPRTTPRATLARLRTRHDRRHDRATSGDCSPGSGCHVAAPNVVDRLEAAGFTWSGYFESMGTDCKQADSGLDVAHHDPFIYFDSIRTDLARCASHVVDSAHLATDLASAATTPNFVFVAPNDDNNDGAAADTWLSTHLPAMLQLKGTYPGCSPPGGGHPALG